MPGSIIFIIGPIKVNYMAGSASILIGDANYTELTHQKEYKAAALHTGDSSPMSAPVTSMFNDPQGR